MEINHNKWGDDMEFCMDCGKKLELITEKSYLTKYFCEECNMYWHKRTVVEWVKKDY
jgi:hypothetical protein